MSCVGGAPKESHLGGVWPGVTLPQSHDDLIIIMKIKIVNAKNDHFPLILNHTAIAISVKNDRNMTILFSSSKQHLLNGQVKNVIKRNISTLCKDRLFQTPK